MKTKGFRDTSIRRVSNRIKWQSNLYRRYLENMKRNRVKLPKNVYQYFLQIKGSGLFIDCVLRIVNNPSRFESSELATEIAEWYNKQEDPMYSLYLIQEYGMEIEE